jgi:putative FmdB family regulatory protein
MPTYEYACRDCGEHVEVVQSFRDDPLDTCGLCGGRLRKVFSAAGIIFKGSGYYVTDTRSQRSTGSGTTTRSDSGGGDAGSSERSAKDGSDKVAESA